MGNSYLKKVGRWDIAGLMTRNIGRDIPIELAVALKQVGLQGEKMMKKYIIEQKGESASGDYKWKELDKAYLFRKGADGYSTKTLIRTSTMVQSISSQSIYPKVFIGVKRGVAQEDGQDVANIAAIMEFGSQKRNIPARKFIAPVGEDLQMQITEQNLFGQKILKYLRKKYGL